MGMKFKVLVEYEYPTEHKLPVKAELVLHGDRVTTDKIKWLESKTGHWIKSNIGGAKVCSVCQSHMGLSNFKYCPNCGAKMVEPQESEGI